LKKWQRKGLSLINFNLTFLFEKNNKIDKLNTTNKFVYLYLSDKNKIGSELKYKDLDDWFYSIISRHKSESFCSDGFNKQDERESLFTLKRCAERNKDGFSIRVFKTES